MLCVLLSLEGTSLRSQLPILSFFIVYIALPDSVQYWRLKKIVGQRNNFAEQTNTSLIRPICSQCFRRAMGAFPTVRKVPHLVQPTLVPRESHPVRAKRVYPQWTQLQTGTQLLLHSGCL